MNTIINWKNPEEVREHCRKRSKEYYHKNKEKFKKINLDYYYSNKEKCLTNVSNYNKRTNYKNEKTLEQRKIRNIKRETRRLYPLKDKGCKFCSDNATEHHHNTIPIQVNKFDFVCKDCHKIQNKKLKKQEENKNELVK